MWNGEWSDVNDNKVKFVFKKYIKNHGFLPAKSCERWKWP